MRCARSTNSCATPARFSAVCCSWARSRTSTSTATDTNFSVEELAAIAIGYKRIIEEAAGELKDLGEIINPTDMSLTDKDRIDVVERVYGTLMRHRRLAGYFTRRCISVSLLRARTHRDMERVVALYGTDEQRYW